MGPVSLPSPSSPRYILVETTDVDSTTNQSTVEFPTTNATATITVESPHLEPPTSFLERMSQLFPPQPIQLFPPQPILEQGQALDLLAAVIALILLLLGASVILYHIVSAIAYTMTFGFDPYGPEIHVHSVSLSVQNISSSQITTKGEIEFDIRRPIDCASPVYDNIVVSVFYEKKPLSMTVMEPFTQEGVNHTTEKAMFPSITSPIDPQVLKRMASKFSQNSCFEFSFDVKAKGTFWPNDWIWMGPKDTAEARWVNIWCPDVKVEMVAKTGMGTMVGEPFKCEVQAQNPLK